MNTTENAPGASSAAGGSPSRPHITIKRESSSWNGWCVHYAGMFEPGAGTGRKTHCDAGVEYASVAKQVEYTYSRDDGHRYDAHEAHPCFKHEHPLTNGCAKCRFPTAEEIKAHDEEATGHIKRMMTARAAIIADLKRRALAKDPKVFPLDRKNEHRWHKPQEHYYFGGGVMECPVCKTGKLHYSRAGYNGHVHARCSTANCVAWME